MHTNALAHLRARFAFPDGNPVYLCGNSLGLMPKSVKDAVNRELDAWASLGVDGHFKDDSDWYKYHELCRGPGSRIVGALEHETVYMNSLTVNLHLMLVSFFRPEGARRKLMCDWPIFPSDIYAFKSHLRFHGLDESDLLIQRPRDAEHTLRTEDVIEAIDRHQNELALIVLAGVNFATGQFMDMPAITAAARERGITIGWQLAHGAGNVPMQLHEWGPDFAVWCTYKYMNSGPGALAGCFIHEHHHAKADPETLRAQPRFEGWWGNDPDTRFRMGPDFVPVASADAWQLSNPPVLATVPVVESLKIFDSVGMDALRARSLKLTAHLESLLDRLNDERVSIITPRDPEARGCQLSVAVNTPEPKAFFDGVRAKGLIGDFRQPNIIRLAPTPLYNSFEDCDRAVDILKDALS